LPRAALAGDEHDGRAAHQLVVRAARGQGGAGLGQGAPELMPLGDARDADHQLLGVERFRQVVERALFQGRHGVVHRAVGRDQDHVRIGVVLAGLPEERDAIDAGQPDVRHDHVEAPLGQQVQGHRAVFGDGHLMTGRAERITDDEPNRRLVIHQEKVDHFSLQAAARSR
jgi:hypothetical protein